MTEVMANSDAAEGTRRNGRRRRGKGKHWELVSVRQIAAKVCRQLEFLPERDEWARRQNDA